MNVPLDISRPLLFLSRSQIPKPDVEKARQLCTEISNWELFTTIAFRKFSLPMVYRNLMAIGVHETFPSEVETMRQMALQMTMATLRVVAAQTSFQKDCVAPLEVKHVYLKGPALASRYYDDAGLRFSRDVDLLVARDDQERLVRHAMSKGYRVLTPTGEVTSGSDEQYLRALFRYNFVITLMSPIGAVIEVHREVSKKTRLFEAEKLLSEAQGLIIGTTQFNVLPTTSLFNYLCYHNTRHTWSSLHWLSDLNAIVQHPTFDKEAVLQKAASLGLLPTVQACLEFGENAFSPNSWGSLPKSHRGGQILKLCLKNLEGDLDLEREIRSSFGLLDLPFGWMLSGPVRHRVLLRHSVNRIAPDFEQYQAWPLPGPLQWLYFFARPVRGMARFLSLPIGRKKRS